jgi:flagellar basal-body rod protein FlgB
MSINFKQALGVHADALQVRADRTRVLASNIANETTPGFKARDVDFASALAAQSGSGGGLDSGLDGGGGGDTMFRVPYHPSQDGNTVEIGVEQAAFSQNASDFQASVTFINLTLKGLAKAINGQ